jgi:transcriptional regulator with XRE-family HTH domain
VALTDPGEFGARLRRYRERVALSQEALAEGAGMTAKAGGALVRGERRRPYPRTVLALSDALGLDDTERAALAAAIPRAVAAEPNRLAPDASGSAPTPLYGRDPELTQLLDLLVTGRARLVTITGPGGVGKTRLATEVVRVWPVTSAPPVFTELAAVRDPASVLPTVASALGVSAPAVDLVASVASLIADRDLLLVIDNLEHLLDAAPAIAELVARCPRLTVLTTSRAPLRTRAEVEFPLGPLPLPRAATAVAVAASAAADVFVGGCARSCPASRSTPPTPRRSPRSAGASTGCHWRSSSPHPTCAISSPTNCSIGSIGSSTRPARATPRPGTARCGRRSTGATTS